MYKTPGEGDDIYIYIDRLSPLYLHDIPMNNLKIIMISQESYLKIPKYIYYIHYYGISTIGILEIMDPVIPKNDYIYFRYLLYYPQ